MKKYLTASLILVLSLGSLVACNPQKPSDPSDPFERYNRAAYHFNEIVDQSFYRPVAVFYDAIMPPPVNIAVTHFFDNLGEITNVMNDLLQADLAYALFDSWRFIINTTIGIGGILDVASAMHLPKHYQDFGVTLACWGITRSPYFVIPFLGPSTLRDLFAIPIDYSLLSIWPHLHDHTIRNIALGLETIDKRAYYLRTDKLIRQAFDPYAFVRNAYLQKRKHRIEQARVPHGKNRATDDRM